MGQLGLGDNKNRNTATLVNGLSKIQKIYCGGEHTMAINENNELYVWGWNEFGQLGLSDNDDRNKPTLNSFFKDKKIIRFSCGIHHCLALIENGEVYSWGYNRYGQLGVGDTNHRNTPTLISFFKGMKVINVFASYHYSNILLGICISREKKITNHYSPKKMQKSIDPTDTLSICQDFLRKRNIEGTIIFSQVVGSRAYNVAHENSDFDYFGVYAAPTQSILGLENLRPPSIITNENNEKPDIQIFEISKFIEGLIHGQPTLFQSLFVEKLCYQSEYWKKLKEFSLLLLTERTIKSHFGYIRSQLKQQRVDSKNWPKYLYTGFRILFEVERMIKHQPPKIFFEGEERNFLLSVRRCEQTREAFEKILQERLKQVEKMKIADTISDHLSPFDKKHFRKNEGFEKLNDWLVELRLAMITKVI